jgi:hypothetical protein
LEKLCVAKASGLAIAPRVGGGFRLQVSAYGAAVVGLFVVGLIARLHTGLTDPLWLDEGWTGAVTIQKSLPDAVRQMYADINAPLYYMLMFAWVKIFGISNLALRLPNVIMGLSIQLIVLAWANRLGRITALTWSAAMAAWVPGLLLTPDARCYVMLLLNATLCTLAFASLMAKPTVGRAAIWAVTASLALLTHYFAVFLLAGQALTMLVVLRRGLFRLWPAAFVFTPALGSCLFHLPRVLAGAAPDVVWYERLRPGEIPGLFAFQLGSGAMAATLVCMAVLAVIAWRCGEIGGRAAAGERLDPLLQACAASLVGMGLCILLACVRPCFTIRYLVPFTPGCLLGLALLTTWASRRVGLAPAVVLAAAFAVMVSFIRTPATPNLYSFEGASTYLRAYNPQQLMFLWDNPTARAEPLEQLQAIGGFFFHRMDDPIPVEAIHLARGADPNQVILARARPHSALIWVYDLSVRGVAARTFPPRLAQLDARWSCRNFGKGTLGVLACQNGQVPPAS